MFPALAQLCKLKAHLWLSHIHCTPGAAPTLQLFQGNPFPATQKCFVVSGMFALPSCPCAELMQVHPAVRPEPCPASVAASRVNIHTDRESLSPATTLLLHTSGLLGMAPGPPVASMTPSAAPAVEQGRHGSIYTLHYCFPLLDFITHLPEGSSHLAHLPWSEVVSSLTSSPSETVLPMAASDSSDEEGARKAPHMKPPKAPFSLAQTPWSRNSISAI